MRTEEWNKKYKEHISSFEWHGKRMRLIKERGGVCERCRKRANVLQLHHKTYERLGNELDSDLEVVCIPCHEVADKERAEAGRRKANKALYEARLDGWATKRYGEDWDVFCDAESIAEEFSEWLDRREGY